MKRKEVKISAEVKDILALQRQEKDNELQTILTEETVRNVICPKATDQEIIFFLNVAKAFRLNPFTREIYLIKYEGYPAQYVVGYEVYIKRAEEHPQYMGFKFWTLPVDSPVPKKACCEVYRKDRDKPFYHEVLFSEYQQFTKEGKATRFWREKPCTMLKKVVLAQALRLCFPSEFGGLPYAEEEIDTSKPAEATVIDIPTEPELVPDKVEQVPDPHDKKTKETKKKEEEPKKEPPKKEPSKKEEPPQEEKTDITYEKLAERLKKLGFTIGQITMWFMKKFHAKNIKELTPETLKEADKLISEQEKSGKKSDPARTQKIKKVFAVAKEKLDMPDEDIRQWCRDTFGKGLSEMDESDIDEVLAELEKM